MDAITIRLDVNDSKTADRDALVDKLFSDLCIDSKTGDRTWNGQTFMLCANSDVKRRILALFGANHSLQVVDENIDRLIKNEHGYLECKEDNELTITKSKISLDIATLCGLIASSLSHDLIGVVSSLLKNINEILSSDKFFAFFNRVDVNVFAKSNSDEMLVVHVRFSTKMESRIRRFWLFSRSKKVVKISLALRKVGICKGCLDELVKANPHPS